MKSLYLSLLLFICLSLPVLLISYHLEHPGELLSLTMCDVGQGDAFLISRGSTQVLIDTGKDESVLSCLNRAIPFWDKSIEMVILTHPDADHIGGVTHVADFFQIKSVVISSLIKKTDEFTWFEEFIQVSDTQIMIPSGCLKVFSEGLMCFLLSDQIQLPNTSGFSSYSEFILSDINTHFSECSNDCNDLSINVFLNYGELDVLFTGDITSTTETSLINRGLTMDLDMLKIPHHGSKTGSSTEFLQFTKPEVTLLSYGLGNQYGHPHPEIVSRLVAMNSIMLKTGGAGDVVIKSDGTTFWW